MKKVELPTHTVVEGGGVHRAKIYHRNALTFEIDIIENYKYTLYYLINKRFLGKIR